MAATIRPFVCEDLFRFSNVNLDSLTETYHLLYYLQYLTMWPEYFEACEAPDGRLVGYVMGKVEGKDHNWHGHVSAVTVAPEFRQRGHAARLMNRLEATSEKIHNAYFVDLFVRSSNSLAVNMYRNMEYVVYRTVLEYYSDNDEDAFDMRKALPRDINKRSVVPIKDPILPHELEYD